MKLTVMGGEYMATFAKVATMWFVLIALQSLSVSFVVESE